MGMFDTMDAYFGIDPRKTVPQGTATTLMMMLDDLPTEGAEKLYYYDSVPGKVARWPPTVAQAPIGMERCPN